MEGRKFNGFGLSWDKNELINLVHVALAKQLEKEVFTSGDFQISVSIAKKDDWSLRGDDKTITLKLPLVFSFTRPEGLFSVEGEGGICLELACTFRTMKDEKPYIDVDLLSFDWFIPPVVTMGHIDFPVEFLADILVRRVRDNHLEHWVKTINERWDISALLADMQKKYARNVVVPLKPEWYFNLEIRQWVFVGFQDHTDDIKLIVYLDYDARLTDKMSSFLPSEIKYTDKPVSGLLVKNPYHLIAHATFEGLERMLTHYINNHEIGGKTFDVEKISIRNTSVFEIKILLRSPVQGTVTISGNPRFDRDKAVLDFTYIKVDISASQFFYQLSSPIIEKIVRGRIRELLPLPLGILTNQLGETIRAFGRKKALSLGITNVRVDSIQLTSHAGVITCAVDEFSVKSAEQNWSVFSIG